MYKIIKRKKNSDSRGWFLKVLEGNEEHLKDEIGEFYITVALPKKIKGGHYHKLANEWFTLISGSCILDLYENKTSKRIQIKLSSEDPVTVFVPPNISHRFINVTDENFILVAYSDQKYDPIDTIHFDFDTIK